MNIPEMVVLPAQPAVPPLAVQVDIPTDVHCNVAALPEVTVAALVVRSTDGEDCAPVGIGEIRTKMRRKLSNLFFIEEERGEGFFVQRTEGKN